MTEPAPDVELLADLDAGLLDPEHAAAVRAAALADPRAAAVLDALAATRAELRDLDPPAVPPAFAARWSAALADAPPFGSVPAGTPTAPTPGPAPADPVETRPGVVPLRSRRPARRSLLVAAAAVLLAALVAGTAGLVTAGVLDPRATVAITGVDLGDVGRAAIGRRDFGPLTDPGRRQVCLAALRAPGDAVGGLPVDFEGTPGVLLVLLTGGRGEFRIVVVDETCSAVLAETTIGG